MTTLFLIDGENMPVASLVLIDRIIGILDGPHSIRLYGNRQRIDGRWITLLPSRGPVQFIDTPKGKNLADLRMTADGLVLASTLPCKRVVITSSDRDLVHLLEGLKAFGRETVLIAGEGMAVGRMRAAADFFVPYREGTGWPRWVDHILPHVLTIIRSRTPDDDGYLIDIGTLGVELRELAQWFQPKHLGFRNLSRMMANFPHAQCLRRTGKGALSTFLPDRRNVTHVRISSSIFAATSEPQTDPFRVRARASSTRHLPECMDIRM